MTAPAAAQPAPFRAERRLLLFVLLGLAVVGWIVVVRQAVVTDGHRAMGTPAVGTGTAMGSGGIDLTMGMAAPLFLAMWMAMMVAMMFPAAAPMIVAFERSQSRRRNEGAVFVPTWLFVAPYLVIWFAMGLLGYLVAVVVENLVDESVWAGENLPRVAGGFLVAAGLYQLTPLKRVCLSNCRSPLSFMLRYWRNGRRGAVAMGLRHGLYCLGCCWVLFLVLFPLGVMNVAAMVAVALLVFAEKALPGGERVAAAAAVALVAYGLLAVAVPAVLPTLA